MEEYVQEEMKDKKNAFKIGKDEILHTQYSKENGPITHILCKKRNV